MSVLIIGGGAVGQVYGHHLARAGAQVDVYVKPKYAEEAARGFVLYPLGRKGQRRGGADAQGRARFVPAHVHTRFEDVSQQAYDQVWLCVPADAVTDAFAREVAQNTGNATLVLLTPGLEDRARFALCGAEPRLVQGAISLISYQSPLANESRPEPGVAYWFPPMSPSPFDGPSALAKPIVEMLRKGGCPAALRPGTARFAASASAIMMPHLVALEGANWSLRGLRKSGELALATQASREALDIVAKKHGVAPPFARRLVRPFAMRLLLSLAPRLVPFDLETYLRYHFTKVGPQTRLMIRAYIERGLADHLPVAALTKLQQTLTAPAASHG